jgi:hypothetical protein
MVQTTGETRDAIIEDDNKRIQEIVAANSHLTDPYWIVIFAKESRNTVEGRYAIAKHIKAYNTKPRSQVGMITGEVNNRTGEIKWEVNMPQKPFDYEALTLYGAKPADEIVTETTTIADSYITQ